MKRFWTDVRPTRCERCQTLVQPGWWHECYDLPDWPDTLAANLALASALWAAREDGYDDGVCDTWDAIRDNYKLLDRDERARRAKRW